MNFHNSSGGRAMNFLLRGNVPEMVRSAEYLKRLETCEHFRRGVVSVAEDEPARPIWLCGITDSTDPPCPGCPFYAARFEEWWCFRESSTGRWMADVDGRRWVNQPADAYRLFRIESPWREFPVMEEVRFEPWTPEGPSPNEVCGHRISATAFRFRRPARRAPTAELARGFATSTRGPGVVLRED